MSQVTAYCKEAHSLKLGPGLGLAQTKGELIVFTNGFATFDSDDFPDFGKWLVGAPPIEILDRADGQVASSEFTCDLHDEPKAFATKKALNGHLMSHKPKPTQ